MNPQPATEGARRLLAKLTALAERGVNGEKTAAQKKLRRLKARYDFTVAGRCATDFLAFPVTRAPYSSVVGSIPEMDIANAVKWAFEHRFNIACGFSGANLVACVVPASAENLKAASETICVSFRTLWKQYATVAGSDSQDRRLFMAGLYDGMMADERKEGEALPVRIAAPVKRSRAKKNAVGHAARVAVHPYSVAVGLGRQIRFNASLDDIKNELENTLKGLIS